MSIIFKTIDLSLLENALASLREGLKISNPTELERDGIIQRFEFSFELCWKTIRKVLLALGRNDLSASPRPILRAGFEEALIDDLDSWFEFLESRNSIAHVYNKEVANNLYFVAKNFLPKAEDLITRLKEYQ